MSIVSVDTVGVTSSVVDMDGTRKYTVSYRVVTDDRDDQSLTVMTAAGIPSSRDSLNVGNDIDNGAYPKSYSAVLQDSSGSGKTWTVLVRFEASMGQAGKRTVDNTDTVGGFYEYPWDQPARVSGHGIETQSIPSVTYATATSPRGTTLFPIENSVKERPVDLDDATYHTATQSLTIEQDFQFWPADLEDYTNTLNSSTFWGKAIGTYRMGFPTWERLFIGDGTAYYNITFEFFYEADGWNAQSVKNSSWHELDSYLGVKIRAKDGEGLPTAEPVLIDNAGFRLAEGENALWIYYHPYASTDFGALGIPISR